MMTKILVTDDEGSPGLIFESSFTDEGDEVVAAIIYGEAPVLITARTPIVIL